MSSRHQAPGISLWPAMIDLVTATLMVVLLVSFLKTVATPESYEMFMVRDRQARFEDHFERYCRQGSDEITRERDGKAIRITFSDGVLFKSAKHELLERGRYLLQRCAAAFDLMEPSSYDRIQVEGHTDAEQVRSHDYPTNNWELSAARAITVVEFLAWAGIEESLFSANAFSSHRPVDATRPDRNRRVEIRVFFSGKLEKPGSTPASAPGAAR